MCFYDTIKCNVRVRLIFPTRFLYNKFIKEMEYIEELKNQIKFTEYSENMQALLYELMIYNRVNKPNFKVNIYGRLYLNLYSIIIDENKRVLL